MKNLLIMPLLILLTGCVTYYYPETALEDGVYYAEDDPSYVLNSGDYSGVVYYPWSSLDYFYLGYWPYAGYGFVYGFPYGPGYSPWYFSHYPGYYRWPHRRNCFYSGACVRPHHGNRYAQDEPGHRRNRSHDGTHDEPPPGEDGDIDGNNGATRRYVTTPPPGYSGEQGMVIRSSERSKMGNSRTQPVKPVSSKSVSARRSTTGISSRPSPTSSMRSRAPHSATVSSPSGRHSSGRSRTSQRRDRD